MRSGFFIIIIQLLTIEISFGQDQDAIISSLKAKFNLTEFDRPSEIIKFNEDTILVAGYLEDVTSSTPRSEQMTNIVYKTTDGGIHWKRTRFNGSAWIYDSHSDKIGNVWMGGSDNYIHYSPDFGETWQRKPSPFPSNRIHSIFMATPKVGIAGGLHNGLAMTFDNWNSVTRLPTPLDQHKFKILPNSSRDRVESAEILDSIIVINQNDHIYYSSIQNIKWTAFNIPVSGFAVDLTKKEITLQSLGGRHFVLDSTLELVNTYQNDFIWTEIKTDSVSIDTNKFFESEIKSVSIKSTHWIFDKPGHMVAIYKPIYQEGRFIKKGNAFLFKSKKHADAKLQLTSDDLNRLFKTAQVNFPLAIVGHNLEFTDLDIQSYTKFLTNEAQKRNGDKEWGGDFTGLIPLNNQLFTTPEKVLKENNADEIVSIYNYLNYPDDLMNDQTDKIELLIVNDRNDSLHVSNANSLLYSLPWTIQLGGQRVKSFNPEITKFVRSILPADFVNYEMLLAGELIYRLVEEQIIAELQYKKVTKP